MPSGSTNECLIDCELSVEGRQSGRASRTTPIAVVLIRQDSLNHHAARQAIPQLACEPFWGRLFMSDGSEVRDFASLCADAGLGLIVMSIGLAGMLLHKQLFRTAAAFGVCLIGLILTVLAAGRFHEGVSQTPFVIAALIVIFSVFGHSVRATICRESAAAATRPLEERETEH